MPLLHELSGSTHELRSKQSTASPECEVNNVMLSLLSDCNVSSPQELKKQMEKSWKEYDIKM